jgi:benzoyl-CoA reductase subunit D
MTYTIGIDIGSGAVKTVLFEVEGNREEWLAKRCERIRRRDPMQLAREGYEGVLADAGLRDGEIDYVATTGEGENVTFATGHFYSMTTHARGGVYLHPGISAVVDIGALSKTSSNPEKCSSICAVLAETDVINMVSRGIATPDVLKGIHLSMASRIVKLLKVTGIKEGTALITGGLALDTGLIAALQEETTNEKVGVSVASHPDSIYAGAIGAALWGAYRHARLADAQERAAA